MFFHPFVGLHGRLLPAGGTGADDLHEAGATAIDAVLKSLADGALGLADGGYAVHALARHIAGSLQLSCNLRDLQGISVKVGLTTVGAGGCLHSHQRGGSHLAAGHAIDGVVDEDDGDVLTAVQRVDGLGGADTSQVAVALVGEDKMVGPQTLDGRGDGGCAAVGGFLPVDVNILVCEDGTAHGRYADGLLLNAHLFDNLCNELVHDAV